MILHRLYFCEETSTILHKKDAFMHFTILSHKMIAVLRIDCVSVQVKRLQFIMNRKNESASVAHKTHIHAQAHSLSMAENWYYMSVCHFYGNMSFWGFSFLFICKWALPMLCALFDSAHCMINFRSISLVNCHVISSFFSFLFYSKMKPLKWFVSITMSDKKNTHWKSFLFIRKIIFIKFDLKHFSLSFDLI